MLPSITATYAVKIISYNELVVVKNRFLVFFFKALIVCNKFILRTDILHACSTLQGLSNDIRINSIRQFVANLRRLQKLEKLAIQFGGGHLVRYRLEI